MAIKKKKNYNEILYELQKEAVLNKTGAFLFNVLNKSIEFVPVLIQFIWINRFLNRL